MKWPFDKKKNVKTKKVVKNTKKSKQKKKNVCEFC